MDTPERRASLGIEGVLDPVDLRVFRVALDSEDRRDTEACGGTGARTERTVWTEWTESRGSRGETELGDSLDAEETQVSGASEGRRDLKDSED